MSCGILHFGRTYMSWKLYKFKTCSILDDLDRIALWACLYRMLRHPHLDAYKAAAEVRKHIKGQKILDTTNIHVRHLSKTVDTLKQCCWNGHSSLALVWGDNQVIVATKMVDEHLDDIDSKLAGYKLTQECVNTLRRRLSRIGLALKKKETLWLLCV